MLRNNYICALDIGSSKICACLAKLKKRHLSELFLESAPARGVAEGTIVDSIQAVNSISRVLKNLKATSGVNIKYLYANISGQDITTKHSRAIIPLAERGNKVIALYDVQRVHEQARILGSSLEEEIIHQIPFSYSIDSKENILNPLGLYSHRLETDLFLISSKLSSLQSLSRVVNQAGFELKGLFLSGLANSSAIFNPQLKNPSEGVEVLCDIGADITEILTFRSRLLRDIKILRLGGNSLTRELSDHLKIPFELAEDVKRSYVSVGNYEQIDPDKEILIKKDTLYKPIKQQVACQIVSEKAKFLCGQIKQALEKDIACHQINSFIACGRTVLLEGFLEMLETSLGIPVKLGRIRHPELVSFMHKNEELSSQKYLGYLTSLGIICLALQQEQPHPSSFAHGRRRSPFKKVIHRVREVYQEYF